MTDQVAVDTPDLENMHESNLKSSWKKNDETPRNHEYFTRHVSSFSQDSPAHLAKSPFIGWFRLTASV